MQAKVQREFADVLSQSGELRHLDGLPGSSVPRGLVNCVRASRQERDAGEESFGERGGLRELLGGRITAWGWGLVVKALRGPHSCLRDMAGVVGQGTGPPLWVGGPGTPTGGGGGAAVSAGGACPGAYSRILTMLQRHERTKLSTGNPTWHPLLSNVSVKLKY